MKGIEMYAKIQELKEIGMSQNAVAVQLGISVPIAALPPKHKSTVCMVDIAI